MCGIAGLFLKSAALQPELGRLTALMLHEMRDRGPDSAGFAIYDAPEAAKSAARLKLTCLAPSGAADWARIADALAQAIGAPVEMRILEDHAILSAPLSFAESGGAKNANFDGAAMRRRLIELAPEITVLSAGAAIELFKGVGDPDKVAERFGLAKRAGGHALAHTRMATESAVVTAGSHPFSTGADACLVHNGSLSNHNRLRRWLERRGETFQTENDSEVAAGYLSWRLREGDTLEAALERAIEDLDGFYTFAIGSADGFAVLRDPIACKPAVIAETDDWVAMASEFRAIAKLPGVEHAAIWEPRPGRIYSWSHSEAATGVARSASA
ncbi:MAG: glutamine amidotransferase family protein [Pseudomonadota bacterium]